MKKGQREDDDEEGHYCRNRLICQKQKMNMNVSKRHYKFNHSLTLHLSGLRMHHQGFATSPPSLVWLVACTGDQLLQRSCVTLGQTGGKGQA